MHVDSSGGDEYRSDVGWADPSRVDVDVDQRGSVGECQRGRMAHRDDGAAHRHVAAVGWSDADRCEGCQAKDGGAEREGPVDRCDAAEVELCMLGEGEAGRRVCSAAIGGVSG